VDSINSTISKVKKKIHDLKRDIKKDKNHLRLAKAAKHGIELAAQETALKADEAAKKTADWALNAAKKTVKVGTQASPEVVALTTALGTEEAGLKVAEGTLIVARDANKGVEAATKAVLKASSKFKINKIGAAGSVEGILTGGKKGKAPVLIIDCTIAGKRHVYREGIGSAKKEFEHLAKQIAHEMAKELVKVFKKG
jgi:hypothetical protein